MDTFEGKSLTIQELYQDLLDANSEVTRNACLERLLPKLEDRIKRIVHNKVMRFELNPSPEDREDLIAAAMQNMVYALLSGKPIKDIGAYLAQVTKNCILKHDEAYKRWYNAKCRVRSCLQEQHKTFYEWPEGKNGALRDWRNPPPIADADRLSVARKARKDAGQLVQIIEDGTGEVPLGVAVDRRHWRVDIASALWRSLNWFGGATPIDDLVVTVRAIQNDVDVQFIPIDSEGAYSEPNKPELPIVPQLKVLWPMFRKLGRRDARAIFLGRVEKAHGEWSYAKLFIDAEVATETELADLLKFTAQEFRCVLPTLPWSEKQIADHLKAANVRQIRAWRFQGLAKVRELFVRLGN